MDANKLLYMAILGGAVSALTGSIKLVVNKSKIERFMPIIPLLLGAILSVLVPTLSLGSSIGENAIYGILAGAFSGQLYQIVDKQFNIQTKNDNQKSN